MVWIKRLLVLAVCYWGLKLMGVTPRDVWDEAKEILANFARDGEALVTGEAIYSASQEMRAARPRETVLTPPTSESQAEARELGDARGQLVEQKFDALKSNPVVNKAVNAEGMKSSVLNSIRQSGGGE